ncbi:MAG TPA: DNA-3-methyladenine glycosylase I [Candidatus Nesterenkonia stercoripullorum]|uniref:DNA-3-methyladenine glycosylase I n=1 Tax=Candidatus Nesterenkonia stercoripullorum TaxID=2838701 RepID=A0A9D1UR27_9MICC|nr:DNA-3-methyladenine glycosylase I [Candidatus Nesterenkonia stercoripullorum]
MSGFASRGGALPGPDGRLRTPWALGSQLMMEYYDTEWGMPVTDERGLFERLCLEGFQSGLSWATVLAKRDAFRQAFAGFDPERVAAFSEDDVQRLLGNPGIIRHRGKIAATITNARATLDLRAEGGLAEHIWSFAPDETPVPYAPDDVPTQSPESQSLARSLKARGFRFVGPTTMYALMEAVGIVDTHVVGSYRRGSSGIRFANSL